jgi:hypothetical protein
VEKPGGLNDDRDLRCVNADGDDETGEPGIGAMSVPDTKRTSTFLPKRVIVLAAERISAALRERLA